MNDTMCDCKYAFPTPFRRLSNMHFIPCRRTGRRTRPVPPGPWRNGFHLRGVGGFLAECALAGDDARHTLALWPSQRQLKQLTSQRIRLILLTLLNDIVFFIFEKLTLLNRNSLSYVSVFSAESRCLLESW